jgi:hypothetical protein
MSLRVKAKSYLGKASSRLLKVGIGWKEWVKSKGRMSASRLE